MFWHCVKIVSWSHCTGGWTDLPGKPRRAFQIAWTYLVEPSVREKCTSHLAIEFSYVMCEVRDIESEWTVVKSSFTETAARSGGQKAVSDCHGSNHRTRWWAPLEKDPIKLKK